MDYRRHDYYRRGRSPSPRGRFRRSRSRDRSYSPDRRNWSRDRRGRSPERYSSAWRQDSPRRRSYSRSSSRSRSRSRGRYSRSPNRYSRRSRSYNSHKRHRDDSSSSDSSIQKKSNKPETKDDFYRTMYADREEQKTHPSARILPTETGNAVSSHSLRMLKNSSSPGIYSPNTLRSPSASDSHSSQVSNQRSGTATQVPKSEFSSLSHGYNKQEIDDEERFLYGDDAMATNQAPQSRKAAPEQPSVEDVKEEATDHAVTPGGFDSNALKNVLKAIGFDFEMSAQQLQAAAGKLNNKSVTKTLKPKPALKKPVSPVEQPAVPPQAIEEAPQPIQTISGGQPSKAKSQQIQTISSGQTSKANVQSSPVAPQQIQTINSGQTPKPKSSPAQQQQPNQQQYFQSYDPFNLTNNAHFNTQNATPTQQVATMAFPSGTVTSIGYPITIQDPNNPGGTLIVYPPPGPQQAIYHQADQTQGQSGRIVLPPQRLDQSTPPEKDERQERLNYLQEELEKLKKQQNELIEKKKIESEEVKSSNWGLASDNGKHAAGKAGHVTDSSDDSAKEQKDVSHKYEYLDPGNHWCKLCNTFSPDLMSFLSHLHSKTHRKAIDPYDRPWDDQEKVKKHKSAPSKTKSLKGAEFLIPVTGYYCTICQIFSGDQICADEHLKSHAHNDVYKKYCKKNPSYEKKYKKKKKAAFEEAGIEDKRNGKANDDIPKSKSSSKQEKEEKWVEKVPKVNPTNIDGQPLYQEFKPYASDKVVYNFDGKYLGTRPNSNVSERKEMRSPKGVPPVDRVSVKSEKFDNKDSRMEYSQHDSHRKREYDRKPDDRPSDHGRRRKAWSPGYDEYERQQHDNHEKEEKLRHGHGERHDPPLPPYKRSGRWIEKPPEPPTIGSIPKLSDSERKPHGFPKFSWHSGLRGSRKADHQPSSDLHPTHQAFAEKSEDNDGKSKIAIKITGKTQYPQRLSGKNTLQTKSGPTEEEKKAVAEDLKKKVAAIKRENALRNQLSSITLPARGHSKQSLPNTAAVMLGTRTIGKHHTLLKSVKGKKDEIMPPAAEEIPPPPPAEITAKPPPPEEYEPPPPGEEDMDLGIDADARSDASGISMELASDEG